MKEEGNERPPVLSKGNSVWMKIPVNLKAISGPTQVEVSAKSYINLNLELFRTDLRDPVFRFGKGGIS